MIRVTTWGSRGSIPVSGERYARYGGATTCLELELEGAHGATPRRIVIDCGTGLVELARRWGARAPEALILQTHMHWDHLQGFPFFAPLYRREARFELWAAERDRKSLPEVLDEYMRRPTFPIGLDAIPAALNWKTILPAGREALGELTIRWCDVTHPSGCTAYRFDYRGASLVFTGDVEVQLGSRDRLIELARGAEVLIMDAQDLPTRYRRGFGHSTSTDAVEVASKAGARRLLLTHHDPSHDDAALDAKVALAREAAPGALRVEAARDGLEVAIGAPAPTPAAYSAA
jgi:phosphoribosyl 1,2-cyclic phosphodiesterase